jgi:5-formyltetrahydrofolate cyclo-ligase
VLPLQEASERKQAVRERVWRTLEKERVARFPGAHGRIPNFKGAEAAASRLAAAPAWRKAAVVKANPDAPQLLVRALALAAGKLLFMAVPRLVSPRPFIRLEPRSIADARRAASIAGAARLGTPVSLEEMERIDLVVCGSVAVNRAGARIGKGGGYSDLEFAILTEAGLGDRRTALVTTAHPLQVLEEKLPETEHDFRVDLVVTPEETIATSQPRRPGGVLWEHLDDAKLESIPVLRGLGESRPR